MGTGATTDEDRSAPERNESRRDRQKLRRRRAALDAARDLFASKGYDVTSLQEIADRADIGIATLYNYFGSKRRLLFTLALDAHDGQSERLKPARIDASRGLEHALLEWITVLTRETMNVLEARIWLAVLREEFNMEGGPRSVDDHLGIKKQYIGYHARFLEALAGTGIMRKEIRLPEAAELLDAIALEVFHTALYYGSDDSRRIKERSERLLAPLISGLRK